MNSDHIVVHYNDKEYMRILSAVIKKIVGDEQTTEDVVHNAFYEVLKHEEKLDEIRNMQAWIIRLAKCHAWQELKQRSRFPYDGESEVILPDPWRFESELNFRVITATIDTLSPAQAEIARLRLIDDMTFRKIAETTGKSLGAVNLTFRRGQRNLRRELAELR